MATDTHGEFEGTDRFEVQRRLGAGGMGVVYEAYDRERAATVALKTLTRRDAAALYRFKREFRGLADISHPNLAALHELVSAGDDWFFTMELVDGVDFITYVRGNPEADFAETIDSGGDGIGGEVGAGPTLEAPQRGPSPPPSYERLREALRQLAEGVFALHQAGKLHRDIKPSNVMVDRNGRVVLLDFGLITDVKPIGSQASGDDLVGTADYMSPEQGASRPLTPASDWYAVGTVLYRALTGVLPFTGPPIAVLMDKQKIEPVPAGQLVAGLPDDLAELCTELLRTSPEDRPSGSEVLERLGSSHQPREPRGARGSRSSDGSLVGRDKHVAELEQAFARARAGRAVVALVRGRSGMGKSFLVDRCTRTMATDHRAIVLAGRCYERESVPYKALDSLIDALTRYLAQLPRHEVDALLPRDALAMARLFPVMRRVEAIAAAPRRSVAPDPHELRRRGLAALRELLGRMADRRPVVLTIDDLQWGDVDSTSLLVDLLRPPDPPALLLILAFRSEDADASSAVNQLIEGCKAPGAGGLEVREIEVGALSAQHAELLAQVRLGSARTDSAELARVIAREAGGDPFLVEQLVGFVDTGSRGSAIADVRFEQVMATRLADLDGEARHVLELVCVASRPIEERLVARAAGLGRDQAACMSVLRAGSLIRTSGAPEQGRVETYHDRVREAVLANLDDERYRALHLALAEALAASDRVDPEALAQHFASAGQAERGADYAIEAAGKATAALAFDRAALFYQSAIDALSDEEIARRRLRALRGDALANAGRGAAAAAEYLSCADTASAADALELRRRAAEQLLRCGHMDDGLRALETVLEAVGMRLAPTPRRAMMSLMRMRLRARIRGLRFTERDSSQVSAEQLSRVDICWSVAVGLGLTDPIRGSEFQTRHLLLALEAGEPNRVCRALAMEAAYSSIGGLAAWKRTERLLASAQELAERIEEPQGRGLVAFASALAQYQLGRWQAGREGFERAAGILRGECTGVSFEITSAQRFAVDALFNLGELGELRRRVPQHLREAERRGDLYGATDMRTGLPNCAWLIADEPALAREQCEHGKDSWSKLDFYLQHYYELMAQTHIDLYVGDAEAAAHRLDQGWARLQSSLLMGIQAIRSEAWWLRGRVALAIAGIGDAEQRRAHVTRATFAARQLIRQDLPGCHAQADALEAGLHYLAGDDERAAARLEHAESRFRRADMALCEAVVKRRRGQLMGGQSGRKMIDSADRWMREQTVVNCEAMARLVLGW